MKMMMIDENYKLFGRVKRKTVCTVPHMNVLQLVTVQFTVIQSYRRLQVTVVLSSLNTTVNK